MLTRLLYRFAHFGEAYVRYRGKKIKLLIADNGITQTVGLMYRKRIGTDESMLFVFGRESYWGIWMYNMNFSIDVVWLDSRGIVVSIARNLKPCKSIFSCKTHVPEKKARYVLEFIAGTKISKSIVKGMVFPLPKSIKQRN